MMLEMLILCIIITIILFILIIDMLYYQDTPTLPPPGERKQGNLKHVGNWRPALILIIINLLFIVITTYGFYSVDFFYMSSFYSGNGTFVPAIYNSGDYYVYAWMYYVFAFIHVILVFKVIYDAAQESLLTEGEMDYSGMKVRR